MPDVAPRSPLGFRTSAPLGGCSGVPVYKCDAQPCSACAQFAERPVSPLGFSPDLSLGGCRCKIQLCVEGHRGPFTDPGSPLGFRPDLSLGGFSNAVANDVQPNVLRLTSGSICEEITLESDVLYTSRCASCPGSLGILNTVQTEGLCSGVCGSSWSKGPSTSNMSECSAFSDEEAQKCSESDHLLFKVPPLPLGFSSARPPHGWPHTCRPCHEGHCKHCVGSCSPLGFRPSLPLGGSQASDGAHAAQLAARWVPLGMQSEETTFDSDAQCDFKVASCPGLFGEVTAFHDRELCCRGCGPR